MDIMNCALPCPPLDEEALIFAPTGIDILKFFDDIDDEGNLMEKPKPRRTGKQMLRVIEVLKPNWELFALPRHPSGLVLENDKPERHGNDMQKQLKKDVFSAKVNDKSKNTSSTNSNHPELKLESSKGVLHQAYDHESIENAKKEKAIQSTDFQTEPKHEKCPNNQKPDQLLKEVTLKENAPKGKNIISEVVVPAKSSDKSKSTLDEVDMELKLDSTTRNIRQSYKDIENKKRKIQVIDFRTAPKPEARRLAKKPRSCGASRGMQKESVRTRVY